jgi:5-enolpyruvylshikimate-3-phosphate synthase
MVLRATGTTEPVPGWQVALSEGADPDELPYVEMTRQMTATFPHSGGTFQIEPDASSASYFHAANALFPDVAPVRVMACQPPKADGGTGWQIDAGVGQGERKG